MAKQILIDSSFGMVRTAIAEDNELVDYYEESPEQGRNKGNIYRGVVKKVDAPIQAAFVKFAGGRDGFLPLRDASAGKPPKPGDAVLVQVVKDEVGDKGAALTAKLSLSGRYLVYIPERDGEGGISSKITEEERAALKQVLVDLRFPEGASVILRTAATDKSVAELQADLDRLIESHREIVDKFGKGKDPGLLFREAPPALRYLREYYTEEVERIWVNQEEVQDQCRQFFYLYEPKSASKVVLSQDGPLLFHRLGLEAEVEKLSSRKVTLPSGANIVIDQAEALVAIDVNSAKAGGRAEEPKGKTRGKGRSNRGGGDLEETVFAVNKDAAVEIARQLRLRDLGGIIIVDFIDMEQEKHRRQIEEVMRKALALDKAKVKVFEISPLGIMQISRQRLRKAGHQFTHLACDACQGRGWHASPSAGALAALRKLEERLHGKKAGQSLAVSVPYPVANKLMNEFRDHVIAMEKRYGGTVRLNALPAASGEPVVVVLGGDSGSREARPADREAPAVRSSQPVVQRRAEARGQGRGERRAQGSVEERGQGNGEGPIQRDGERRDQGNRQPQAARRGRDGRRRGEGGTRPIPESVPTYIQPVDPGFAPASEPALGENRTAATDAERQREPMRGPGGEFAAAVETGPGTMAAGVAEIVNAEVTLGEAAPGAPPAKGHRRRRGGRGRGRGRGEAGGSAPLASPSQNAAASPPPKPVLPLAPKAQPKDLPRAGNAKAPARGRSQARPVEVKAEEGKPKPAKSVRPRRRRGPGAAGQARSGEPAT
jgi:Rne/Rng family ribonuclease